MNKERFSVDAAILEELGERLIGRPSIALGELIKNAYDADATVCELEFAVDSIVVADNGHGMSETEFREYWLRLGTTHKMEERFSRNLNRPLTGSKGVGRLAAQFLAEKISIETAWSVAKAEHLSASVDWQTIERGEDLASVEVTTAVLPGRPSLPDGAPTGTRITLRGLKQDWTAKALEDLGGEVWRLRPPGAGAAAGGRSEHRGFDIRIQAPEIKDAQALLDKSLKALLDSWGAHVTGVLENGRRGHRASLTVTFRENYPSGAEGAETYRETVRLPVIGEGGSLLDRVKFDIRIYNTKGRHSSGLPIEKVRDYLRAFGNVSVYDSGFRLPYYGGGTGGQDWLNVAVDQGRRLNASELLPGYLQTGVKRFMLDLPAPGRIVGSVEIDTNHERRVGRSMRAKPGEWLEIQSARDRLQDNDAFRQLHGLVRYALDYYANRYRARAQALEDRKTSSDRASHRFTRVLELLEKVQPDLPRETYREIREEAKAAQQVSRGEEKALEKRAALLAPLASAGMAALSLAHELAREITMLDRLAGSLRRRARKQGLPEFSESAAEVSAASQRLRGLQQLFSPLIGAASGGETATFRVRPIAEQVAEAMSPLMPSVVVDTGSIPNQLRFPEAAYAEWSAIFQNVLANSWNAMLECPDRRVRISGGWSSQRAWVAISDSGAGIGVPIEASDKLFEPFERRLEINETVRSVALGGQGLGLAIVRMIAARREVRVRFVEPAPNYSTTLELSWRTPR